MKPPRPVMLLRSTTALLGALLMTLAGCGRQSGSNEVSAGAAPSSDSSFIPLTNMVLIKPGTFVRGKQVITIARDFWLGKYEVTQAEFSAVMGSNPSFYTNQPAFPVEKVSH